MEKDEETVTKMNSTGPNTKAEKCKSFQPSNQTLLSFTAEKGSADKGELRLETGVLTTKVINHREHSIELKKKVRS